MRLISSGMRLSIHDGSIDLRFVNHVGVACPKSFQEVKITMRRRTFLTMMAAGLAGCRSTASPPPPAFSNLHIAPYRLDSGDRIRITVYDQASLTNLYTIDQAGHVSLPLIGSVGARGRTTQELAGSIAAALRKGFLRDPDVSVEVDTYRPFFIMGEVRAPGQYTFVTGLTVQTAIAIAGGFTPRADEGGVEISRQINGEILSGIVPITDPVRPGDVLRVRMRFI